MIPYTLDRSLIAHCTLYQGSRMTNMWTMKSVGIGKCQLPNDKLGRCWLVGSFRHTFRLMLHYFLLTPPICLEIYRNSYLENRFVSGSFTPSSFIHRIRCAACYSLVEQVTIYFVLALQHFSCWVVRSLQLDWSASECCEHLKENWFRNRRLWTKGLKSTRGSCDRSKW